MVIDLIQAETIGNTDHKMALPIFGQVLNSSPEIPMQVNVFRESLLCIWP